MTKDPLSNLTDDDIVEWLRKNPKFLQRNPDAFDSLVTPKEKKGKGVADFQYYMVERLKADRDDVIEATREIVENSRANMNNLARIHRAVLMLLEANSFDDFIRTITMDFVSLLNVDIISFVVENDTTHIPQVDLTGVRIVPPGTIDALTEGNLLVLEAGIKGTDQIYGGGAGLVRSQALLRLTIGPDIPPALIAFGSRDPHLFHEGQGTDLVSFLGQAIERCFRTWLAQN